MWDGVSPSHDGDIFFFFFFFFFFLGGDFGVLKPVFVCAL